MILAASQHRQIEVRFERSFAAIPGNQIYRLNVETRHLNFPHLNSALDGLTLTLISDLHFTGNICQAYFEQVVEKANELDLRFYHYCGRHNRSGILSVVASSKRWQNCQQSMAFILFWVTTIEN